MRRELRWGSLLMLMLFSGLLMGGCELSCDCDDNDSIEDAIDEVGDEVEDVVDRLRDEKRNP